MTPRQGLYVALVGLTIAGLCTAPLLLLRLFEDRVPYSDSGIVGVVLIDLGLLLGLVVMVMGLVMTGIASVVKGGGK